MNVYLIKNSIFMYIFLAICKTFVTSKVHIILVEDWLLADRRTLVVWSKEVALWKDPLGRSEGLGTSAAADSLTISILWRRCFFLSFFKTMSAWFLLNLKFSFCKNEKYSTFNLLISVHRSCDKHALYN